MIDMGKTPVHMLWWLLAYNVEKASPLLFPSIALYVSGDVHQMSTAAVGLKWIGNLKCSASKFALTNADVKIVDGIFNRRVV